MKNMTEENAQDRERMFSWMNPKLEVRDTGKYGKGVFAKENLKKDGSFGLLSAQNKEIYFGINTCTFL